MRKIRVMVAAAVLAVPIGVVTASPAAACKQHPCQPVCKFNPPVYVDGDQIAVSNRPLWECYY
jgi:hypothetical protein